METSGKTIAKNTIFLYFRMLCIMFVSLYTSRVVLNALGVEDFGIYQTVGGIVVMLSFLNSALSTGSSRFLTFELGKGMTEKLKQTFSTLLLAHVIIGLLMLVVGEPFGIWFLKNHVIIPDDKISASYVVFHLSIITSLLNITQVPYTSVIIAHEKLSVYAYVSIVEVLLKLGIAFAVQFAHAYKLEIYALLLAIVQAMNVIFYRIFCIRNYDESRFRRTLVKFSILKDVGGFAGWSLFASISIPLTNQGTLILLNNFFSPAVVSARSVALQVNNAANQFISNFRTASNPQIVKRYSAGDFEGSKKLLLNSTLFSYYLMLFLALPIYILAEPLLKVWLVEVPEYSDFFLKWSMIASLFSVFDVSFYTALYAKGRLKENALLSPVIGAMQFPILYFLFKLGFSPRVVAYSNAIVNVIIGCVIKPILICKICGYSMREIFSVIIRCVFVTLFAVPVPFIMNLFLDGFSVFGFIMICVICVICTGISVFIIGLDKDLRKEIIEIFKRKLDSIYMH